MDRIRSGLDSIREPLASSDLGHVCVAGNRFSAAENLLPIFGRRRGEASAQKRDFPQLAPYSERTCPPKTLNNASNIWERARNQKQEIVVENVQEEAVFKWQQQQHASRGLLALGQTWKPNKFPSAAGL